MKSKIITRFFHLLLSLCIIVTVVLGDAGISNAVTVNSAARDIKGNPAESQITYLMKKGILTTYNDKTYKPNQSIKRIEFVIMVNKLFGFVNTSGVSFTDVTAGTPNAKEVSKAIAAGYISGYSNNTFKPNNPITMQESAQIICNLLNQSASNNSSILNKIKDLNSISQSMQPYVSTAIQYGYMSLYAGNVFKPAKALTRGEAAVLLFKASGAVINTAGIFNKIDGSNNLKGNLIINTAGVSLNNIVINGSLFLTEGIGEGNVQLNNVTVKGKTFVAGGGTNSITVQNSTLGDTIVNKKAGKVRLVASGSSSLGSVFANSSCLLEENGLTGTGFNNVTVNVTSPISQLVQLKGSFSNVSVNSRFTELDLTNASINNFATGKNATGAIVKMDSSSSMKSVQLNASANIQGQGSIKTLDIRAAGVSVQQIPTYASVTKGITATVAGTLVSDTVTFLPTISSAALDLNTGKLTITGNNMIILAGLNNDITSSKLTITSGILGHSRTLSAASNADITSSTSATLTLTASDISAIKDWFTGSSNKSYNLSAAMGWNGASSPPDYNGNPVTITGNISPTITSGTLNLSTGQLAITGTNLMSVAGSANDIIASKLTISDSNGGHSRTLTSTSNSDISSSTIAIINIGSTDLTAIKAWALQNGISQNGYAYNIAATAGWNGTSSVADMTGNTLTVSGNPLPSLTSATLNLTNGQLVLTGSNFISITGSANDITSTKFTLSDGAGGHSRTLSTTGNFDITNSTTATMTISGADLTAIIGWAIQNGTTLNGNSYNLSASAGWNGSDSLADLTGNPVTVSGGTIPTITSATLNISNGYLTLTGTNFISLSGSNNDITSSLLTVSDGAGHTRTLGYTTNFDIYNSTTAYLTLSSYDYTAIAAWAVQNGSSLNGYSYYLSAAAGWNGPSSYADTSNSLIISGNAAPTLTSATLNVSTGQLVLTGTGLNSLSGTANDILAAYFTIGETSNVHTRTLSTTSNVDIASSTSATLTVASTDLSTIASWAKQDGTTLSGYSYYISATAGWNGPNSLADNLNQLAVSGNSLPSITSADLNVSTGTLTIVGANLVSIAGSNNDIIPTKFTISDGTAPHTYTIATTSALDLGSSTLVSVPLSSTDLNLIKAWATQNGSNLNGNNYRITAASGWNGSTSIADTSGKSMTISGNPPPSITSATLDVTTGSGLLLISGTGFTGTAGSANDVVVSSFTISDGLGGHTRKLLATGNVDIVSSTSISITLNSADLISIKTWATQNGVSLGSNNYVLSADAQWNGVNSSADANNPLTISGNPLPTLTSAALDLSSGVITITGSNFISIAGAANDITGTLFVLSDGTHSTTISSISANVDILGATSATFTITDPCLATIKGWATTNGTTNSGAYNLAALAGWNGPSSSADLSGNPVTVSGNAVISLQSAVRDNATKITVTLSKLATPSSITVGNDGGFTVCDALTSTTTYGVISIAPGTSTNVVLTIAYSGNSANVIVKYTAGGHGTVADQSGNLMASNASGITVLNATIPGIAGNVSFADAAGSANDGKTIINFSDSGSGNTYKYKVAPPTIPTIGYQVDGSWIDVTPGAIISVADAALVGLAEVNGSSVVSYSTGTAFSKPSEPAVKTAGSVLSGTINFATIINTSGASIILDGHTSLNLTGLAALGDGCDAATSGSSIAGALNSAAAASGYTVILNGSNHLVITSTATGIAAVIDFGTSSSGPDNNLLQLLGFTDRAVVPGKF